LLVGDPTAPTAVRDPIRALDDHLADALVALDLKEVRGARAVADLGSGAGVPGLPLAIALPTAQFSLVESSSRKCAFLHRARDACAVANARVVHARAESWSEGLRQCDLVTARALAPLPVVVEYAAPLLRIGGSLVVWRGRRDPEAEAAGARAATELGLDVREPESVDPYPGAEHRYLHLMLKANETPAGFPRRDGVARKRPLGAVRGSPSGGLPAVDSCDSDRAGDAERDI
jgi:16S rRNA (guanine527-N7)-methyltransferase